MAYFIGRGKDKPNRRDKANNCQTSQETYECGFLYLENHKLQRKRTKKELASRRMLFSFSSFSFHFLAILFLLEGAKHKQRQDWKEVG